MFNKIMIDKSQAIILTLIFITISLTPAFADISKAQTSQNKTKILDTNQKEIW